MKQLIGLSILVFTMQIVFAQNYQCIKDDAKYYFTDGSQFKAIHIDSIVPEGDDLDYYNFPAMGETEIQWCYTRYGPSWIGRKITAKPNGGNIFYNIENQPILIKTQGATGEFWNCFVFNSGNFIRAKVESIQPMTFLGITDTVKTISFQAMDTMWNPFSHQINNMYLLLSQHYGLIRTVNFKVFPDLMDYLHFDECHEYELCGISEPAMGTANLTAAQIFDYSIGDEIHTNDYMYSWTGGIFEHDFKFIYQILDKEVLSAEEIVYTVKRCARMKYINGSPPNVWDTIYFINDTIIDSLFFGEGSNVNDLNAIPDQIIAWGNSDYYEY